MLISETSVLNCSKNRLQFRLYTLHDAVMQHYVMWVLNFQLSAAADTWFPKLYDIVYMYLSLERFLPVDGKACSS